MSVAEASARMRCALFLLKPELSADYTARQRPQPNKTLAPEEPNVYRHTFDPTTRAPAERNVRRDKYARSITFRSSGARTIFLNLGSINISSLAGRGAVPTFDVVTNLVRKTRS